MKTLLTLFVAVALCGCTTTPKATKLNPCLHFEYGKDSAGQWYWNLKEGGAVLSSGSGYVDAGDIAGVVYLVTRLSKVPVTNLNPEK